MPVRLQIITNGKGGLIQHTDRVGIIRQNIGISLAVKVIALALTLAGITTLWMAVAFDLGTSLLVTANALRLTRWQLPGSGHQHAAPAQPVAGVPVTGVATGDA